MARDFSRPLRAEMEQDHWERFVTSWLLSPLVLAAARGVWALYATINLIYGLTLRGAGTSFAYFTNITFWSIWGYSVAATFHGLWWTRTGRLPLARWPGALRWLHSLLYTTVTVFPILVTAVYWALLYPEVFETRAELWTTVTRHALNSAFCLFEIVIPRTLPLPWIHLPFVVVFLGCYAGLSYVIAETEGFYTYDFLDPSKRSGGALCGLILGMAAGVAVLFIIVRYLIWGRNRLTQRRVDERSVSRDAMSSVQTGPSGTTERKEPV